MSNKREQIIQATCQLIELQGYHASGLNQIVAESKAPKGSLYHYFPEGKDEIVEAAIDHTSHNIQARLQEGMDAYETASEAIPAFIRKLSFYVEKANYEAGGPITAVAVEVASTNERLNTACQRAYRSWQAIIEEKLLTTGYDQQRARRLATMTIAMIEGAILLSRNERSITPLLDAATELERLLDH